ncbi:FAD-dependent oxidoreductase [Streptomyces sp. JV176]|uniref:NAD(P)/FAD-dependent oxidoreductase n=1 Tax=Streptomyces sp. JV176 TaxID=858630 RepID=UPI002E789459|nr:FAD-dependent oxidoreductase [Streptomyces sp. JV176]MEE1799493.1 FAD-dependent oxidoreductase [Streptomyces sp. JV176]
MQHPRVVIIGAGHGGIESAAALRMLGHDAPITIVGDEPEAPYARPPLSKAFLAGTALHSDVTLRNDEFFARERIDLRVGTVVTALAPLRREVRLENGEVLRYDKLILATGAVARMLPDPAITTASNVHSLRTMGDAVRLRERLRPGTRATIIGGGYIGLEIAAAAQRAGVQVTLLEAADRVLARVTSEPVSDFFQRVHAEEGVEIITGARISGFGTGTGGDVTAVELSDGRMIGTDFVLVGIGVAPRTDLAEQAGILVDNGIVVNEFLQASAPDVYAVGDVARHPCPQNGGLRRLESVPNATENARTVANHILGDERPHAALPWFWSDQFDLKLQSVGLAVDIDDIVVREYPEKPRKLAVFYLRGGRLVAADVINSPADFAFAKKLVLQAQFVHADQLADASVSLKNLLAAVTP